MLRMLPALRPTDGAPGPFPAISNRDLKMDPLLRMRFVKFLTLLFSTCCIGSSKIVPNLKSKIGNYLEYSRVIKYDGSNGFSLQCTVRSRLTKNEDFINSCVKDTESEVNMNTLSLRGMHRSILRLSGGSSTAENMKLNPDHTGTAGNRAKIPISRQFQPKIPVNEVKKSEPPTSSRPKGPHSVQDDGVDEKNIGARTPPVDHIHDVKQEPVPNQDPSAVTESPLTKAFGFYELLNIERGCDAAEIRRAYKRLALAAHPDRHRGDPTAHARFLALQRVYDVLRDPDRRQLYDDSGGRPANGIDGGGDLDTEFTAAGGLEVLLAQLRDLQRFDEGDLVRFEEQYRGSPHEAADVEAHYRRRRGDVRDLTAYIPYAEDEDMYRLVPTRLIVFPSIRGLLPITLASATE